VPRLQVVGCVAVGLSGVASPRVVVYVTGKKPILLAENEKGCR
jgi:hypothetical protein